MRSSPTPIPKAYEKLVDRLLASPHYGERMALRWLDAARYADSNGFQQDGDTWQWIWRDWLVKALNDDMPFDQFTIRLLAGDLLPEATIEQKDRQRIQPQSSPERRRRRDRRGTAVREPVRPDRHHRHDLARPDDGVCPVSRSQVSIRSPSATTTACSTPSTACRRAARRSSSRRGFASRHRSSSSRPRRTRRGSPSSKPRSEGGRGARRKLAAESAFEGWRVGDLRRRQARGRERACPTHWPRSSASPRATARDDEKKTLDAGLAQALRRQGPPDARREAARSVEARRRQETARPTIAAIKLPRVMIMSDAKPRQTAILTRGEYLKPGRRSRSRPRRSCRPCPRGARPIASGLPAGWSCPSTR